MKTRDFFILILVTAIWGFNFIFIKLGLSSFPPIFFCSLRFICSSLAIFFLKLDPQIKWKYLIAFGLVLGVGKFSCLYLGIWNGISPGIASLLSQSQIFFTLILSSAVLKDHPSWIEVLGIGIAALGIFAISQTQGNVQVTGMGLSFIVAAACCWAIANLIFKKVGKVNMMQFVAWMSLIPPIPLLLISFATEENQLQALASIDLTGLVSIFYISMISTLLGYGLWGRLLSTYPASTITPFGLLIPVFGILGSFLFLGERLTLNQMIACGTILAGLALTVIGNRSRIKIAPSR